MNFSDVFHNNKLIGHEYKNDLAHFFFGTAQCDLNDLKDKFSNYAFSLLNQIHGDQIIEAKSKINAPFTADAQWTNEKNLALIVRTADCLPILFSSSNFVCSIHAGWRGVMNEIIIKSFNLLSSLYDFKNSNQTQVFIGPHIKAKSFEVDLTLAKQFQDYFLMLKGQTEIVTLHKGNQLKAFVDLEAIAAHQLVLSGIGHQQIISHGADTFTNHDFASYRRMKESTQRNLSFVARLS